MALFELAIIINPRWTDDKFA